MENYRTKRRDMGNNSRLLAYVLLLVTCVVIVSNCSRNSPPDTAQLAPGKPVTTSIINDEVHTYEIKLEQGEFLGLAIEQHDVDVITKVFSPNGDFLGEFDTPTSGRGTEQIRIGAEMSGDFRVDIFTLSERAEPGQYKLTMAEPRPLTERDQQLLSAIKFHQEADRLRARPETRRDSIPVYQKALQIWREMGEQADEANTLRAMGFAYQRLEELDRAKSHFGQALETWERIEDWRSAAFTHIIFGVISKKRGDYDNGLKEDLAAQPLWERANDLPEYTQNLVRIGNDYIKLGKKAEALAYFEQALDNSRLVERKSVKAYVLSEYGDAHATFGNKSEVLSFYKQSVDLWKSLKQDKGCCCPGR